MFYLFKNTHNKVGICHHLTKLMKVKEIKFLLIIFLILTSKD